MRYLKSQLKGEVKNNGVVLRLQTSLLNHNYEIIAMKVIVNKDSNRIAVIDLCKTLLKKLYVENAPIREIKGF